MPFGNFSRILHKKKHPSPYTDWGAQLHTHWICAYILARTVYSKRTAYRTMDGCTLSKEPF